MAARRRRLRLGRKPRRVARTRTVPRRLRLRRGLDRRIARPPRETRGRDGRARPRRGTIARATQLLAPHGAGAVRAGLEHAGLAGLPQRTDPAAHGASRPLNTPVTPPRFEGPPPP